MERHGIPSVAIITEAFVTLAQAFSRSFGMPEAKLVVVPHPIASRSDSERRDIVEKVLPEVRASLLAEEAVQ